MSTIVKLIPAFIAFFIVAWFVAFQFNPYKWCEDHPDRPDEAYICEPFGFELAKGVIDREPDHKFAGEDKYYYTNKKRQPKKVKTYNCQDADVLMTKEGYEYCFGKKP